MEKAKLPRAFVPRGTFYLSGVLLWELMEEYIGRKLSECSTGNIGEGSARYARDGNGQEDIALPLCAFISDVYARAAHGCHRFFDSIEKRKRIMEHKFAIFRRFSTKTLDYRLCTLTTRFFIL